MTNTVTIDLRQVARGLNIPLRQVQSVVELLDEGNTVPFITRYRKDHTGGLDEEQIREIEGRLTKSRLLADRKQTILRSIESQGKLTEDLAKQILSASTAKRLEDLYLPFKPKKQTLATLARSRGLETLATEILEAAPTCVDLDARAADFVNTDRQVPTAADALLGAGHILAEHISEQAELRGRLREVLQRSGVMVCNQLSNDEKSPGPAAVQAKAKEEKDQEPSVPQSQAMPPEGLSESIVSIAIEPVESLSVTSLHDAPEDLAPAAEEPSREEPPLPTTEELFEPLSVTSIGTDDLPADGIPASAWQIASAPFERMPSQSAIRRKLARQKAKLAAQLQRQEKKKRLDEKKIKDFRDYFQYREEIRKIPPHRVLAINRGERARVLRVRVEADLQAMVNVMDELLVPPAHPHADYLRGCARDALNRLILPSLEREARRELTDHAELHAVNVFAKNLRNLLLQPPIHGHRLLAVDPGFRSGCKLAALDEFGNLLEHGVIYLVGKPDRREEAKKKVLELVDQHQLTVIVIGNGTACRQTEDFVAELVEKELKERGVAYVIVNEAGASVYSTSRLGREEFPEYDATLRGAISIGRRLQDPLSELVKIEPANIGVGLYQHDVKAKHLQTSLDGVVESCVNFVGVDVNTASPALLRYVSGLNQLTARRLYEYRREHGPFRSRGQLREVPGLGEATFVQAAGFLKIQGGDDPLDATWIHPESYEAAHRALDHLQATPDQLCDREAATALAERIPQVNHDQLATELAVGLLTLKDILAQLVRPGRDPREDLPAPVFKRGIVKLEDLAPGMELTGTVLNVVDFGCFVDIGMHQGGLVHVSRLADRFVRDPHDVVAVGDIVKVWVIGVDKERQRVALTMIRPGDERPRPPRQSVRERQKAATGSRAPQGGTSGDGEHQARQRPPRSRDERRPHHPRQGGRPQHDRRPPPPRRRPGPPKPVTPITTAMKDGKEPMRTFGDLLQFYQHKTVDDQPANEPTKEPTPPEQPVKAVEPPAEPVEIVEQPAAVAEEATKKDDASAAQ